MSGMDYARINEVISRAVTVGCRSSADIRQSLDAAGINYTSVVFSEEIVDGVRRVHVSVGLPPAEYRGEIEVRRVGALDGRNPFCVAAWPECAVGEYNPACCRYPKSCSCEAAAL